MFSLLISVISIALVAGLALATLHYGGRAFREGHANVQAAKVRAQAQQLLGANELFKANHGRYARNTAELVSAEYLKSAPLARAAVQAALADNAWFIPVSEESLFLLETDFPEACRKINKEGYGKEGILSGVVPNVQLQCYGPALQELYSMAAKDPRAVAALVAAAAEDLAGLPAAPGLVAAIPTTDTDAAWTVQPTAPAVASSSGSGTEPPAPSADLTPRSSSIAFAEVPVGSSASEVFTFTNASTSNSSLMLEGLTFSSSAFAAADNSCTGSLAVGASCSVTVTFTPTAAETYSGSMTLEGNLDSSTVALSGTGTATAAASGELSVGAAPSAFATQVNVAQTKTVTLQNTGNAVLAFTAAPAISGGNGTFTSTTTCGSALAAGSSCVVSVTFTPTDTTPQNATLTFDTDVSSPNSLPLSGTGAAALPAGYVTNGGLTWSKPNGTTYKHANALTYCSGTLNGSTGWRLPTTSELLSLYGAKNSLNLAGLGWPNVATSSTTRYWTNSNVRGGGGDAVLMYDGNVASKSTSALYNVSCVKAS